MSRNLFGNDVQLQVTAHGIIFAPSDACKENPDYAT